jgi:plasmid stabilization system protein ParE
MIVRVSSDAEADIIEGFWFYERQSLGLGDYFRDCILADIESLAWLGGVHGTAYGYQRVLSKRFPFVIYYEAHSEHVTVVAVLDARRDPSWIRDRLEH